MSVGGHHYSVLCVCVCRLRSVSYSDGLLHMLSEDVLSVWAVGSDEPRLQWTVSGDVCVCVADVMCM